MSLSAELGVQDLKVESCHRLGRRKDDQNKPRPLKVTCINSSQRSDLLRFATRIPKLNSSLGFRRVFIKHDMSLREQEIDRQLRLELTRRREAGEKVFIRGGKIIPIDDGSLLIRD